MDALRWVLFLAGIILVGGVYLISRGRDEDASSNDDNIENIPDVSARNESEWDELADGVGAVRVVSSDELADTGSITAFAHSEEIDPSEHYEKEPPGVYSELETGDSSGEMSANVPNDLLVVINLVTGSNQKIQGPQILVAAENNNLDYGDMKIFHRLDDEGISQYCMANILEPGWFDLDTMSELETTGLSLFMQLPGPVNPLTVFDDMLKCARGLSDELDLFAVDERRKALGSDRLRDLRTKIQEFDVL